MFHYKVFHLETLAGAGDIETPRVRPSIWPSVSPWPKWASLCSGCISESIYWILFGVRILIEGILKVCSVVLSFEFMKNCQNGSILKTIETWSIFHFVSRLYIREYSSGLFRGSHADITSIEGVQSGSIVRIHTKLSKWQYFENDLKTWSIYHFVPRLNFQKYSLGQFGGSYTDIVYIEGVQRRIVSRIYEKLLKWLLFTKWLKTLSICHFVSRLDLRKYT